MFSQKFVSMGVKGLAKLNAFIVSLYIAKKKMQYTVLTVHYFHLLRSFVITGYKGWNNINENQTLHIGNKYHDDATKEASGIITKFEKPNNNIPYQTNDTLQEKQKAYPKSLKVIETIARITHLITKQVTAYRGKEEKAYDNDTSGNLGIFFSDCSEDG